MIYVDNQSHTDPRINLAIEEYLLRNEGFDEPILLFYINEPAVIIGRNQNTVEEIDPTYIERNKVHVVRRLSGGGAVYHDLGNLNYSFITNGRENLHNFAVFLQPVVDTLREMGVPAELGGNSDILVEGKKVSGNAQYSTPNRMFSHGTLLFDTNIEHMLQALNPKQAKIESKAVQSVRSFVGNISDWLPSDTDIRQFKHSLLVGLAKTESVPQYYLTKGDWVLINEIRAQRYGNWNWNVGRSPRFNIQKSGETRFGKLDVRIDVENGRIENIKLFGNFMGKEPAEILETKLVATRYDRAALHAALADTDVSDYISEMTTDTFIEILFS